MPAPEKYSRGRTDYRRQIKCGSFNCSGASIIAIPENIMGELVSEKPTSIFASWQSTREIFARLLCLVLLLQTAMIPAAAQQTAAAPTASATTPTTTPTTPPIVTVSPET